jgi:hypothetical protein
MVIRHCQGIIIKIQRKHMCTPTQTDVNSWLPKVVRQIKNKPISKEPDSKWLKKMQSMQLVPTRITPSMFISTIEDNASQTESRQPK